jgi:DNA polymerase I-like protein with 3'-5' exonuclease and polymerase domains
MFPTLRGPIALDCETRDPDLRRLGPGYHRPDCYICGVAVATESFRHYYPIAHETGPNLDKAKVLSWLKRQLSGSQPKIFANALYDLAFLAKAGVEVRGPIYDIQVAEPLLNENRFTYSLEAIAKSYGLEGKVDDELDAWLISKFGKRNPKNNIWRAPPDVVAPYAIGDVDLPMRIFEKQRPLLEKENLWSLFDLESRLLPMLLDMRMRGVRVDLDRAEEALKRFRRALAVTQAKIDRVAGRPVQIWAAKSIGAAFDELGLEYQLTPKTQAPSFSKLFLTESTHPIAALILEARRLDKLCGTFLEGTILNAHVDGRVYTQFHPLKSDDGGTVTGRLSSTGPNLQFIPVRTDDGKMIRGLFIPEPGCLWYKFDFSQIEFRLLVHDATCAGLPGAAKVCQQFIDDPDTDYHEVVSKMAGISRQFAKTINFGLAYGEGIVKLCAQLNLTKEKGEEFLRQYHAKVPFMRPLMNLMMNQASRQGEVKTLMHRKRRFEMWVKDKWNRETGKVEPIYTPHAIPGSKRAFCHKALNARVQGSAADVLKKAMVDVYESGVLKELGGVPSLTVHDELDGSVPRGRVASQALDHMHRTLEGCVELKLPLKVDLGVGPNWGDLSDNVEHTASAKRAASIDMLGEKVPRRKRR